LLFRRGPPSFEKEQAIGRAHALVGSWACPVSWRQSAGSRVFQPTQGGRPHETIAAAGGIAIGTVKSRISRARAQLRQMLDLELSGLTLAAPVH
jgi:hypothetical protein